MLRSAGKYFKVGSPADVYLDERNRTSWRDGQMDALRRNRDLKGLLEEEIRTWRLREFQRIIRFSGTKSILRNQI